MRLSVLSVPVARPTLDWLEACLKGGAVEVTGKGRAALNPKVRELVRAMHVVLAGGDVAVSVKRVGDPKKVARLEKQLDAAIAASGEIVAGGLTVMAP